MAKETDRTRSGEPPEVASCVSGLIKAFTDSIDIFKRIRERRRKRRDKHRHKSAATTESAPSSAELKLSQSLRRAPLDIQDSYEKGYGKAGERFAKGDAIAHASLAETLIRLNTGLVGIIAAFLNHDSKSSHLNLDYKSLTNLSNASRAEAVSSLNLLYQRLSQSQVNMQIHRIGYCPRCGSSKHTMCSNEPITALTTTTTNSSKPSEKRRHATTTTRQRQTGPTVAKRPIKGTPGETELVILRPKHTSRKGSTSSSSSSSTKSPSTALSSPYITPLASPLLPQYTPKDPFPPTPAPGAPAISKPNTSRRRAPSLDNNARRPTTWPHTKPDTLTTSPPFNLSPPPIPKQISSSHTNPPHHQHKKPSTSPPPQPTRSPPPPPQSPIPGLIPVVKRRLDKPTPSTYTFASDSTKLGEIPQKNWAKPWDYEEADRLNAEAAVLGYPGLPVMVGGGEGGNGGKGRKKGLFGFLRKSG